MVWEEKVELGGRVAKEHSMWRGHRGQKAQEARRRCMWLQSAVEGEVVRLTG